MSVSQEINRQVQSIPEDISFGYEQLRIAPGEFQSAAKALERLRKKGTIRRISKGRFYRPRMTIFGEKRPNEEQLLKPYLYEKGKRVAYITGLSLYNQLGLTTQIPTMWQIASRDKRIFINTEAIQASAVKSYVDVSDDNYRLLGLLDAIKDLKQIPDVDMQSAITIFRTGIGALSLMQQKEMMGYALSYPPRVRALLGAIMEELSYPEDLTCLSASLNPLTKFDLGIGETLIKSAPNWRIV